MVVRRQIALLKGVHVSVPVEGKLTHVQVEAAQPRRSWRPVVAEEEEDVKGMLHLDCIYFLLENV